jgi:HEXXH motif-containing protein
MEMLVHEASHQYYEIADWLAPLTNGTDTALYYSPFKRAERPIDRLLTAYHAFANVLLLYIQLANKDAHANYVKAEAQTLITQLRDTQAALERSPGLTVGGELLWRTLAVALSEHYPNW